MFAGVFIFYVYFKKLFVGIPNNTYESFWL